MAEKMWDMPTGDTDPRGNPETFGGKHQSDTIWSAFDETQSVKLNHWDPSDLRYDQDAMSHCRGPRY